MENNRQNQANINWYPGHMVKTKRKIIENIGLIDVVYELIDARLPLSSKIKDANDYIKGTHRFLIMTKKDLCDLEVTKKWIQMYEDLGYTVLLMDLENNKDFLQLIDLTKKVMEEEQQKRKKKGLKEKEIHALVMGIPNVGKSTLINKLAGKKVANTGNRPGITKNINWLKTNLGILLLDTPGMLWPKIENNEEALALASTAAIKSEILNMTDIGGYLVSFLKNNYPQILEKRYNIEVDKEDPVEIMDEIGRKIGACKHGETDYEKVSLRVYNDVVNGSIKGVTFDIWKANY